MLMQYASLWSVHPVESYWLNSSRGSEQAPMQSTQGVNFNFPFVKPVQDESGGNNNDLLSALQYVQ